MFINTAFNKLVYIYLHFYDRWQINTIQYNRFRENGTLDGFTMCFNVLHDQPSHFLGQRNGIYSNFSIVLMEIVYVFSYVLDNVHGWFF